jgi:hypothetical protein
LLPVTGTKRKSPPPSKYFLGVSAAFRLLMRVSFSMVVPPLRVMRRRYLHCNFSLLFIELDRVGIETFPAFDTYKYTYKTAGCKGSKLDFGEHNQAGKARTPKAFQTLVFFSVPKFGVPKGIQVIKVTCLFY